jgi:SAM-dependent methyltransferase
MTPNSDQSAVTRHYERDDLATRVDDALRDVRPAVGDTLTWADLSPLDQFHTRGLAATKAMAAALNPAPGSRILDIGSGLGGPARYLAAEYRVRVVGIDLSPSFVRVAQTLAERVGLGDAVHFEQGDALDLPFGDGTFDHAWTQHVAMNIADRLRLYRGIHRVVKPGGALAINDIVAGDGRPLIFPVPWAADQGSSFLVTPDEMRDLLARAGWEAVSSVDVTDAAIAWLGELGKSPGGSPIGIQIIMGPEFPGMAANLARNLMEGRARVVQTIVHR